MNSRSLVDTHTLHTHTHSRHWVEFVRRLGGPQATGHRLTEEDRIEQEAARMRMKTERGDGGAVTLL